MKINQYEFLRDGKPFEPTREEIIQFAEHELAEKDKEIENLKKQLFDKIFIERTKFDEYLEKHLRHEICEKIRKALNIGSRWNGGYVDVSEEYFIKLLNQIERGDE